MTEEKIAVPGPGASEKNDSSALFGTNFFGCNILFYWRW